VEHDPFQVPEVRLIARSAVELAALATAQGWTRVALPRPGCGFGGLSWSEVKPAIEPLLDDRFLVVTLP
jgi:O-acetyl-ADP-ribose deacetylase (regulator of RNase III)